MDANTAFIENVRQVLKQYSKDSQTFVLNIDVNNFHSINHLYGDQSGDEFLEKIESFLADIPTIKYSIRIFADYFLGLLVLEPDIEIRDLLPAHDEVMRTLVTELQHKFPACNFSVACGVCRIQSDNIEAAIDGANIARKESKKQLEVKAVLYDHDLHEKRIARYHTEQEIHEALKENRFCFYLQSKVNLVDGSIVGAEALARRVGSDGSISTPDTFLEVMEENGDVVILDLLICRQVCEFLAQCIKEGRPVVTVSINLSWLHLGNPDTARQLHEIAREYEIPPELLEFELTETIFMNEFEQAKEMISELRSYGYHVSLDDFGSGFAGINILQELDFDVLKLDRRFLSEDVELRRRNAALIPNIIDISKRLNIEVLCEGVENELQCNYLLQLGCTIVQGFYFAKPMTPQEFVAEYEKHSGAYERSEKESYDFMRDTPKFKEEKKHLHKERKYSIKWVWMIAVFTVLLISAVVFSLVYIRNETHQKFEDMVIDTLNAYTYGQREKTLADITNVKDTLGAVAVSIAAESEEKVINAYLKTLDESDTGIDYFYVSTKDYEESQNTSEADQETVKTYESVRDNGTVVTDIHYSDRFGGTYCFDIGVPVEKDGQFIGAVCGSMDAEMLVSTDLYNPSQGDVAVTMLTDADGTVLPVMSGTGAGVGEQLTERLAGKNIPEERIAKLNEFFETTDQEAHSLYIGQSDEAMYYLSIVELGYNGWHLAVYMKNTQMALVEQQIVWYSTGSIIGLILICVGLFVVIILFYRKIQNQILENEQQYRILESFSDTVLFEFDCISNVFEFTPNATRLIRLVTLKQKDFLDNINRTYIYPGDYQIAQDLFRGKAGQDSGECRIRVMRPDSSEYFWCIVQCKYIYKKNKLTTIIGKLTDIDKSVQNENQLLQLAEIDSLTGLKNKRTAELLIKRKMEKDKTGLLFVFDMDDFKYINDYYGHAAGDSLLRHMGQYLLGTFRAEDIAGRIGGDEMIVYLSGIDHIELVEKKVELLRKHMERTKLESGASCTVSIGVARYPEDGRTYEDLFEAADQALYKAKGKGKNQYCRYMDV